MGNAAPLLPGPFQPFQALLSAETGTEICHVRVPSAFSTGSEMVPSAPELVGQTTW